MALDALKRKRAQPREPGASSPLGDNHHDDESMPSELSNAELEHEEIEANLSDESEFIVEEDEGTLGAPVDLPLEFSLQTMKPKHLFRFVIEWMVQKKLNPGFQIDSDVYSIALLRLDNFARGMGSSKYTSSAWTARFLNSLKMRPNLIESRIVGSSIFHDRCDACNRSGHPATFEVRFDGSTYNQSTLDDDEDETEDSEEEDSERERRRRVASPNTTFFIGKFCMRNARVAHTLQHWRYHLNEWVVDYLTAEGHCTPSKLLERDRWSTRKRRKYADAVIEEMVGNGEIRSLYGNFKDEIGSAHDAVQPRFDYSSS